MEVIHGENVASLPTMRLGSGWLACVLVIAGTTALLPAVAGIANLSGVTLVALAATAVALVSLRAAWRMTALLIAVALAVRVTGAVALALAAPTSPERMLGPDSRGYLRIARLIAEWSFQLPVHPISLVGSADASPYLVFAAVIGAGADLFGLQMFNCLLGAITAGLAFAAAQLVLPRYALIVGIVVALDPSLILLSSAGLLKDPMVMCASVLVLWGVVVLLSDTSQKRAWAGCSAAAAGLTFLHTSRFYVGSYFEAGLLAACVMAAFSLQGRRRLQVITLALACVLIAELLAVLLGWPSSPTLFDAQIRHVLGMPAMRYASRGLLDAWLLPVEAAEGTKNASLQVVDVIRRLFGPFIWILPHAWDRRTLFYVGDYLLYPGTAIWYALMPYLGLALVSAPRLVYREPAQRLWVAALAVFSTLYLAQFAAVNLSYRQRDAALPLFLFLIVLGYEASVQYRWWRRAYIAYWIALAFMAVAHISVRLATRA